MQINLISEGFIKSISFWSSALVEAGPGMNTGSRMPSTLEIPYYKLEGSLFTLGLLHNYTLAHLTGRSFLNLVKFYSFHLKIVM